MVNFVKWCHYDHITHSLNNIDIDMDHDNILTKMPILSLN